MSDGDIELCLQEIGKYRRLTDSEEVSLSRRILSGDEEAREEVIQANPRLVVSIAKYYSNRSYAMASVARKRLHSTASARPIPRLPGKG